MYKRQEFKNVTKKYKNTKVLDNISFVIEKNKITSLIGESGCGKTTTLKMINRLIEPTEGEILIDSVNIKTVSYTHLDVYKRQQYISLTKIQLYQ